ncbi:Pirin [Vanrija pseudolonga]|uniref:Pirin n=1 Tax=Vanrija pseudolonga TaxID=143232 RepID=A0AAF0Y9N2_9TREE|nr:Pirin [Vanrija pseudolonga]
MAETETETQPPRISRKVQKSMTAFETAEGVGARVKRSVGTPGMWNPSPFLILDWATVERGAGFPTHPHRGMSTLTWVLDGTMQHEDFLGNKGVLSTGDAQWMTAGRGIVHSEMPLFPDDGPDSATSLQLWIDLPAAKKMVKPSYQDRKAASMGRAAWDRGSVTVVVGEVCGATGPIKPTGAEGMVFADFSLERAGSEAWAAIEAGHTAIVYVLAGTVKIGDTTLEAHNAAILSSGEGETGVLLTKPSGRKPSRIVLIAGKPLDQPVVQQGPFVVTSREAAAQAVKDFTSGRNGFEKAPGWVSEIGKTARAGSGRKRRD